MELRERRAQLDDNLILDRKDSTCNSSPYASLHEDIHRQLAFLGYLESQQSCQMDMILGAKELDAYKDSVQCDEETMDDGEDAYRMEGNILDEQQDAQENNHEDSIHDLVDSVAYHGVGKRLSAAIRKACFLPGTSLEYHSSLKVSEYCEHFVELGDFFLWSLVDHVAEHEHFDSAAGP